MDTFRPDENLNVRTASSSSESTRSYVSSLLEEYSAMGNVVNLGILDSKAAAEHEVQNLRGRSAELPSMSTPLGVLYPNCCQGS